MTVPADSGSLDETVLLSTAAVRFVRIQAQVLCDLRESLTYPQFIILTRIGEGHQSVAALASLGRLTPPTVSQSVDGLVRRGLVTRTQDPRDRRLAVLGLTTAGARAVDAARAALDTLVGRFTDRLDDDGRQALRTTLAALAEWADDELTAPSTGA